MPNIQQATTGATNSAKTFLSLFASDTFAPVFPTHLRLLRLLRTATPEKNLLAGRGGGNIAKFGRRIGVSLSGGPLLHFLGAEWHATNATGAAGVRGILEAIGGGEVQIVEVPTLDLKALRSLFEKNNFQTI